MISMKRKDLRYGFTTGACAAAAAKGAALMLRDRRIIGEIDITLPGGQQARFRLHGQEITENDASCFVIKDAGDDPDVTNGAEIHATVTLNDVVGADPRVCPCPSGHTHGFAPTAITAGHVIIRGGIGIGKVTKPGLAVPVGEWAINPVPRRMITEAVREVFASHVSPLTSHVTISIPNGEELAKKTLNARLGIIGGLSILGTTGIVRPISTQAWTDTIESAIDVALACGCDTLVLSTGRTSEQVGQRFFRQDTDTSLPPCGSEADDAPCSVPRAACYVPEEGFIMMGDHVGHAIRACARKGVRNVVIAGQFAKLLKIACGHEQTHVASSKLDLKALADWLENTPNISRLASHVIRANTARDVLEGSGHDLELVAMVCDRVRQFAMELAPGMKVKVLLAGYGGEVLYYGPD